MQGRCRFQSKAMGSLWRMSTKYAVAPSCVLHTRCWNWGLVQNVVVFEICVGIGNRVRLGFAYVVLFVGRPLALGAPRVIYFCRLGCLLVHVRRYLAWPAHGPQRPWPGPGTMSSWAI